MEGLVDVIEEVINVLLHEASLTVIDGGDVALDNVGVRSAELQR